TTREELEGYAVRGYENLVEDLLHPDRFPEVEQDLQDRYYGEEPEQAWKGNWIYRMVNTRRPLEEKIALFWHHVFATGLFNSRHPPSSTRQIEMFRRVGLSDMRTILTGLSKDPAMLMWLDNNENHKDEPNENFGRELLELFSMGVGNYTEDDIKMAARAFTGWTFTQPISVYPHGFYPAEFLFREDDHDDGVKTFLGETGCLNGGDIIGIIVKQPATSRFIARHLYNFFVADEPQVPAWNEVPPQDSEAIDSLASAYRDSGGEIRSMLRVLFNSDFFKDARFKKLKSPAELVAGVIKLVGTYRFPELGIEDYIDSSAVMGQHLLNPPTVEGWHTGKEWIDSGTLNERVNFAVNEVGDAAKPGIEAIIDRLGAHGTALSPNELVDRCLDLVGPLDVGYQTRDSLLSHVEPDGQLSLSEESKRGDSVSRVVRTLQLIVATKEYQYA
ncbi:MAG: DUF1800 domain-containing protein, partial [Dehalococcoidia bacterium]|nr:DUF1800 domain-containing protein [Dehalococcoidia bacterium]